MVRLAVRRGGARARRYGMKRRMGATARRAPARKRIAAKRGVVVFKPSPVLVARMKTFLNNLHGVIVQRKRTFGAGDQVAKRLQKFHNTFSRELKKNNIINPGLVRALNQLTPALKGVSHVPGSFRTNIVQLKKFIREHTYQNVKKFLGMKLKMLGQMTTELKKIEKHLNTQIKRAKTSKYLCKVDPALKQRYKTLQNQIIRFKTFWNKHLNTFRTYGKGEVVTYVKKIKREFDGLQKLLRKNWTLINRYSKQPTKRAGWKIHKIYTPAQQKSLETKWGHITKEIDGFKKHAQIYGDQLKAVKMI